MEILVASLRPAASSSTLQTVDVSCKSAEMGYFVPVLEPLSYLLPDFHAMLLVRMPAVRCDRWLVSSAHVPRQDLLP